MEELIARNIGSVMTDGVSPDLTNTYSDRDSVYQIYDIGATTSRMIVSVKVALIPSRNVSVQAVPHANTFQSKGRHSTVSPEELSEQWKMGLKQARDKISKTTQILIRSAVIPLASRYEGDRLFQTKSLKGMWYIDIMDRQVKSLDGNRYAQVFSNGKYFAEISNG